MREALAVLGVARPGHKLRPAEWAKVIVRQGLVKTLLPPNERDTDMSRIEGYGRGLQKERGFDVHWP